MDRIGDRHETGRELTECDGTGQDGSGGRTDRCTDRLAGRRAGGRAGRQTEGQDRTGQVRSGQFTTRHDTTRHDTTRHDTTRHDTTRHERTRHDTTQHDTTQDDTTEYTDRIQCDDDGPCFGRSLSAMLLMQAMWSAARAPTCAQMDMCESTRQKTARLQHGVAAGCGKLTRQMLRILKAAT